VVLSWKRKEMAAAAAKASSRIGATSVLPATLAIPPKSARPVQEPEVLRKKERYQTTLDSVAVGSD